MYGIIFFSFLRKINDDCRYASNEFDYLERCGKDVHIEFDILEDRHKGCFALL